MVTTESKMAKYWPSVTGGPSSTISFSRRASTVCAYACGVTWEPILKLLRVHQSAKAPTRPTMRHNWATVSWSELPRTRKAENRYSSIMVHHLLGLFMRPRHNTKEAEKKHPT